MLDISLAELVEILGEPTRAAGHQYYFRCPVCSAGGGDTSGDNLLFNDRKGVLKCFACGDGGKEVLQMINQRRKNNNIRPTIRKIEKKQHTPWWQANIENLMIYMIEAHEEMNNRAARWLWEKHGINKKTIKDCEIGYDQSPNMLKIGASVVFPMISINHDDMLVGFELRQIGEDKVIRHTYEAPSCLCCVWDFPTARYLIICEGFKDSYCFKQILEEQEKIEMFTIMTPANGAKDILPNLSAVNFTRYEQCFLLLDKDAAGDDATRQILEKYSFFKDKRDLLGDYEDVADWWRGEYVST